MPPPPSDLARSDEKCARILEAAYRASERRGVAGVRMDEVAELAGVSKGTLYRYFASKEDLLLASIIQSYEQFLPLFEATERGDPRERLEQLLAGLGKVLAEIGPRMRLQHQAWGVVARRPDLEQRLLDFLQRFHAERDVSIERLIREGQGGGAFRPDADIEAFAVGIQALLSGFLYRATFEGERAGTNYLHRAFEALVHDSLLLDGAPAGDANDA